MGRNPHVEGRSQGAALRPLSGDQIHVLVLLAREAWQMEFPPSGRDFDTWRHQQTQMTVERPGLRECRNEDYLPLKAQFLRLLGRNDEADACIFRHENEPRTWAMHALQTACKAAADVLPRAMEYAAGFVRNKRHVAIEDADDKALRHACFIVARKAAQLRKQAGRTAGTPAGQGAAG